MGTKKQFYVQLSIEQKEVKERMIGASYIDIMSSHFRFKLCGKSCQGENLIDYI